MTALRATLRLARRERVGADELSIDTRLAASITGARYEALPSM
jgi:hypothetical protein